MSRIPSSGTTLTNPEEPEFATRTTVLVGRAPGRKGTPRRRRGKSVPRLGHQYPRCTRTPAHP